MSLGVDLWVWRQDDPLPGGGAADAVLSEAETARAARFVRPADGRAFAMTRARLRHILSEYCDQAPEALTLTTTARDKPMLADGPAFNLSHSGGIAVLAVAPDHGEADLPLGVDIEAHRPVEPRMAELSFSPQEQADLAAYEGADWVQAFFHGWTRKEAVIKALGQGLYLDLRSFDVTLGPGRPAALTRIGADQPPVADWRMLHFDLSPTLPSSLPGALACITGGQEVAVTLRDAPETARPVFRF